MSQKRALGGQFALDTGQRCATPRIGPLPHAAWPCRLASRRLPPAVQRLRRHSPPWSPQFCARHAPSPARPRPSFRGHRRASCRRHVRERDCRKTAQWSRRIGCISWRRARLVIGSWIAICENDDGHMGLETIQSSNYRQIMKVAASRTSPDPPGTAETRQPN